LRPSTLPQSLHISLKTVLKDYMGKSKEKMFKIVRYFALGP